MKDGWKGWQIFLVVAMVFLALPSFGTSLLFACWVYASIDKTHRCGRCNWVVGENDQFCKNCKGQFY